MVPGFFHKCPTLGQACLKGEFTPPAWALVVIFPSVAFCISFFFFFDPRLSFLLSGYIKFRSFSLLLKSCHKSFQHSAGCCSISSVACMVTYPVPGGGGWCQWFFTPALRLQSELSHKRLQCKLRQSQNAIIISFFGVVKRRLRV